MSTPEATRITGPAGRHLAFRYREGSAPTVVFLPGYASDMDGAKAVALDQWAEASGVAMLRFDYSGTGLSGENFAEGTLSGWIEEALFLIDRLTRGPLILVGSSMGGWIALHVAVRRPDRVLGMVGIAAAPDFTDWGYSDEEKRLIVAEGRVEQPNPYGDEPQVTHRGFWESGQAHRLLQTSISVDCPVRLIHGDRDEEVPHSIALSLMAKLRSGDVQLLTIKGGGHRLSAPIEIAAILATVRGLLER